MKAVNQPPECSPRALWFALFLSVDEGYGTVEMTTVIEAGNKLLQQ